MNNLQVFKNEQFGDVRVYIDEHNEPWFCGKDVLTALEYSKSSSINSLFSAVPEQWKGARPIGTPGGIQNMLCLSEQGLYFFLGRSDKPRALPYQMFIAGEVMPSIRKNNGYIVGQEQLSDTELMAKALAVANRVLEEREKRLASLIQENEKQSQKIEQLETTVTELEPKASYYDYVLSSVNAVTVTVIAKDYGWSGKKLNQYLHEKGIQYKAGDTWVLYAKYANKGYTKSETNAFKGKDGEPRSKVHTKWTQAGRLFIYSLMSADGNMPIMEQVRG